MRDQAGVGRPTGRPGGAAALKADNPIPETDDWVVLERRVAALEAAVRLVTRRSDPEIRDVLEPAEAFEIWLAR